MLCLSKTSVKRDEIVDGVLFAVHPGAHLGFYKGGCPIHLKGAPPSPRIILTHVTGTKQFLWP